MKQRFFILLSALMLLSFCGCRSSGLHPASATAASTEATTEATTVATLPVPTREAHTQLEFFLEGMQEYQDATLFVGDGYSLYITDDDWVVQQNPEDVTWVCSYNPDITLTVIPNAGDTFQQAKETIFAGFSSTETEGEYVYGWIESHGICMAARLIETEDGILAAVWLYTLEAAEGFGARLRVIASTLEATH